MNEWIRKEKTLKILKANELKSFVYPGSFNAEVQALNTEWYPKFTRLCKKNINIYIFLGYMCSDEPIQHSE